jgi:pyruvate kinase
MEYHGSFGPACGDTETLSAMLEAGMTDIRLNLSHGLLRDKAEWIEHLRRAEARTGLRARLLIDLQGPEIRIGDLPGALELRDGETVRLGSGGIPVPELVPARLPVGEQIQLDDGLLLLEVTGKVPGALDCRVLRGGVLTGRKSLCPMTTELEMPSLTAEDLENLRAAPEFGVESVMLPFVRHRRNLTELRQAMDEAGLSGARLYAKIEDLRCAAALPELLDAADMIVIARGDLGNSMPLWQLPGVQKDISAQCRKAGTPFLVVNQLLHNMTEHPVPTRSEVCDIFNAVADGCAALMLTGETALGRYPAQAMAMLSSTAQAAMDWLSRQKQESM